MHISKTTHLLERHDIFQLLWNSVPALLHALTIWEPPNNLSNISLLCAATKLLWQAALLFFVWDCPWTMNMFRGMFGCTELPCSSWVGGEQTLRCDHLCLLLCSRLCCLLGAPSVTKAHWLHFPTPSSFLTVYLWASHSITGQIWRLSWFRKFLHKTAEASTWG